MEKEHTQQAPKMGLDLSSLNTTKLADQGVDLVLKHPETGEELRDEKTGEPWSITLLGLDSSTVNDQSKRSAGKMLMKRMTTGINAPPTVDELENNGLDILVAATKGWKNLILDGKPLMFSPEAARNLYTRWKWIRDQVNAFISNRGNFLGN